MVLASLGLPSYGLSLHNALVTFAARLVPILLCASMFARGEGSALILQPGTALHIAPGAVVRVLDARPEMPFVAVEDGSCRLECSEQCGRHTVNLVFRETMVTVRAEGEYQFDTEAGRLLVVEGRATVRVKDRLVSVLAGQVVNWNGEVAVGKVRSIHRHF